MKKIFAIALIALFALGSCKKKKDTCAINATSVSGTYRITAIMYKANSSATEMNIYDTYYDACEKDDLYKFLAAGLFEYEDAGTDCSPAGDYSGTWSLSGNTIVVDGDPATVESFDCTNLYISVADFFNAGDKATFTFVRQ
jgi:hypothetical protein